MHSSSAKGCNSFYLSISVCLCVCVHLNLYVRVYVFVSLPVCIRAHMYVCGRVRVHARVCDYLVLIDRPEDHCGRSDPVCEEAVGRDDPDRLLSQCLCSDWAAALHGEPAK